MTPGAYMESEMREQPELLARQANSYFHQAKDGLPSGAFDMVLLAARGSSDHAALYARYLIEINLQIPVVLAAPSVLTRYRSHIKYPRCLAIGISQSGAAPDVAEVLTELKAGGHTTMAITNTANSRMSEVADFTILLNAGIEHSVAATKTYTSSLLALYQTIRALGAELPNPEGNLPDERWLNECFTSSVEQFGILTRSNPILSLGRGYQYCTAQETALKLMECALIPAKGYSSADFQHGPRAIAAAGSAAIIFGELISGLEEQGCRLVIAPKAPVEEPLLPIWEIIFGQWLALHSARGRGLNPDRPEHIQKVTLTR